MLRFVRLCLLGGTFLSCLWLFGGPQDSFQGVSRIIEDARGLKRHKIDAPNFLAPDGTAYTIKGRQVWNRPLHAELCILDVNTDPMTGTNAVWSRDSFQWHMAEQPAYGVLNHFLYSRIHGYRYLFLHSAPIPGRDTAWLRVPAIMSALHQGCRVVLYLDTDAILPHLHLPMEWLVNYWNITSSIAFALSQEPLDWFQKNWRISSEKVAAALSEPYRTWATGHDSRGRRAVNGGVMIIQATHHTAEILRRWQGCPSGKDYVGCEMMAEGWPAEQGAFNEYVRYEYLDHIRELPCEEAHGYPNASIGCQGSLIRHYTVAKDLVRKEMERLVGWQEMENIQRQMVQSAVQSYQVMDFAQILGYKS